MFDEATHSYIEQTARTIRGKNNRIAFIEEARAELWDFMPFDRSEINATIDRVARKYL